MGQANVSNTVSRFVWYELMTTDTTQALAFYKAVLGWEDKDAGMPDMTYHLLHHRGQEFAGLMALPEEACAAGARPAWVGHIGIADADAAVASLEHAGGRVIKPVTDIPGVGRFAVVADSQGAVFDLFQSQVDQSAPPQSSADQMPAVAWHELMTSDVAAAMSFYSGQMGWEAGQVMDMGADGPYQIFRIGEEDSGGIMARPAEMPVSAWLYYFAASDVSAVIQRAKDAGAQHLFGPHPVPGGAFIAQFIDPQGAHFAVVGGMPD